MRLKSLTISQYKNLRDFSLNFNGKKTAFAKGIVPMLDKSCFEPFKPIFTFIKSKCAGGAPA